MIVIVDYGLGNLRSVYKSIKRLTSNVCVSSELDVIKKADKLILPGVGHFGEGIKNLHNLNLVNILHEKVIVNQTPILGICLGMQLMTKRSEEGNCEGLGWVDAETVKLIRKDSNYKIPHMGWNTIQVKQEDKLLLNVNKSCFYFVHSYHVACERSDIILANTEYGTEFTSVYRQENIYGVQFHPEKSHKDGLYLLNNYIS